MAIWSYKDNAYFHLILHYLVLPPLHISTWSCIATTNMERSEYPLIHLCNYVWGLEHQSSEMCDIVLLFPMRMREEGGGGLVVMCLPLPSLISTKGRTYLCSFTMSWSIWPYWSYLSFVFFCWNGVVTYQLCHWLCFASC
jgi:hypothetical protein